MPRRRHGPIARALACLAFAYLVAALLASPARALAAPSEPASASRARTAANDDGDTARVRRDFSASGFSIPTAGRLDPYGPRPPDAPRLSLDEILRYAAKNPAVEAATDQIRALETHVKKAKLGWLPVIEMRMGLSPGVHIVCDDIAVTTAGGDPLEFQWCRPGADPDLDVQTVRGYFQQLGQAGVRFSMDIDAVFPVTTFGKRWAAKEIAKHAVALGKLRRAQVLAETALYVQRAHTTLLLARETLRILDEAKKVAGRARARIDRDLGDPDAFDSDLSETNPDRDPDDRTRIALAEIDLETKVRSARKAEALALAALWALAGEAAPRGFDIAEDRLEPWEVPGGIVELAAYKARALANRPEAKMAVAAVKLRKAQQKLARRNFLPDLGVVVGFGLARSNAVDPAMNELYYQDRFNYSRLTAALALRWKWDFHNRAFDLQRADAELAMARHQRKAAELLLGREVEEAYYDLLEAGHVRAQVTKAADLAWKLVVSQEQRDSVGGGDAKDLVRALKDWFEWRFKATQAVLSYNVALARLSRAVGEPVAAPPGKAGRRSGDGPVHSR